MPRLSMCGSCGKCARCERAAYMREWYRQRDNAARQCESQRKSRQARIDAVREYDRQRGRRYGAPEKERARAAVNRAISRGQLVRGSCEECGEPNADAHHDDYSQSLAVRWLCHVHHGMAHRKVA